VDTRSRLENNLSLKSIHKTQAQIANERVLNEFHRAVYGESIISGINHQIMESI